MRLLLVLFLFFPPSTFALDWHFNTDLSDFGYRKFSTGRERLKYFAEQLNKEKYVRFLAIFEGYYLAQCPYKRGSKCRDSYLVENRADVAYSYCVLNGYKDWAAYAIGSKIYSSNDPKTIHIKDRELCDTCRQMPQVFCVKYENPEDKGKELISAIYRKDRLKVQDLLRGIASIELPDDANKVLHKLMSWTKPGGLEVLRRLLATGMSVTSKDSQGRTPLHIGVTLDKVHKPPFSLEERLAMLLELIAHGAKVDEPDNIGRTPLIVAAGSRWPKKNGWGKSICTLLLDNGADVNALSEFRLSGTPLHEASFHNEFSVLLLLIERGADPNVKNSKGYLPLHMLVTRATRSDVYGSVDVLLNGGADPNIPMPNGITNVDFLIENEAKLKPKNRRLLWLLGEYGATLPDHVMKRLEKEEIERRARELRERHERYPNTHRENR